MEIYLDNCATTKPRKEVVEGMINAMEVNYGNPSSLHRAGLKAEQLIDKSRRTISDFLKVDIDEIFFTSGGTESNNIAIQSILDKGKARNKHIISTRIEHSSIRNTIKYYEEKGFDVTYLNVDKYGKISLDDLRESIREDTTLVSLSQINGETGTHEPIYEIGKIIKEINPNVFFHIDGVQAYGKVPINIKEWGIDTFSFSGHKIYGPKGIGGLYINKEKSLNPIVFGGNQERGLRSGTENVPGIVGLGIATEIIANNFNEEVQNIKSIREYFLDKIKLIEDYIIISPLEEESSPNIMNLAFNNIKGEVLLHYLEEKEIYISTGSACSGGKSQILQELDMEDSYLDGVVRICFSYNTRKEDIDILIENMDSAIKEIRKIIMR